MIKTIKECDLFHNPPSDPNDKKWDEIIQKTIQYSPPIEEDGLEHLERVVLPVSHPNRKSGDDNSSLNASRTTKPNRDNLITIETSTMVKPMLYNINPILVEPFLLDLSTHSKMH